MEKTLKINSAELLQQLKCDDPVLGTSIDRMLKDVNTHYRSATQKDVSLYREQIHQRINASGARRDKDENYSVWERGWRENLQTLKVKFSEDGLKPKYFRYSKFFRYNQSIIVPKNQNLEHELFYVVRDHLFRKYFHEFTSAYELGSGSCQNVYALSQIYPEMKIVASDWTTASAEIAGIVNQYVNADVTGIQFDMLNPPHDFDIDPHSIVFSIHALEQLNTGHEKLIHYLLEKKPALVLNYEPIVELYNPSNLYDRLALQYSKARGYLSGYLTKLRQLESQGRLEIVAQYRPYIGGIYHEASLIVWKPL